MSKHLALPTWRRLCRRPADYGSTTADTDLIPHSFIHSFVHSLIQQQAPMMIKVLRDTGKDKMHEGKLPERQSWKKTGWTPAQPSHLRTGKQARRG